MMQNGWMIFGNTDDADWADWGVNRDCGGLDLFGVVGEYFAGELGFFAEIE